MSVRDAQRERVLDALATHLLETGLAQSSLRQLAAAAEVSDRMLLYYFADKTEVLDQAMDRLAARMTQALSAAIPPDARLSPAVLMARAGRFVLDEDFVPYMRLWLEVVAAAARGEAPFAAITAQVTQGFLVWIGERLDMTPGPARDAAAAMVLALVDGLVLVDIAAGAARAREALGALDALAGTDA